MSTDDDCKIPHISHIHDPDGKTVTFPIKKSPTCPEHDYRESLTDAEFWAHVYQRTFANLGIQYIPEESIDDIDEESEPDRCLVCGSTGACMYDSEGRPLIHSVEESDED